jgi:NADP-dependent aldehyde dehydrogenase
MGSVNPVVILPSALAARADALAEGLANSVTLGSGQFCTNPGLIFIEKSTAATAFVQAVVSKLAAKPPTVLLNQQIESGLIRAVEATKTHPHVELLVGGTPINGEAYCYANTAMQTTAAAFRADPRLQTEHFGPVTLFVLCEDRADLLATLDHLEGNLTATIHAETTDLDGAGEVAARLQEKVGRLIWNGFPTGVEVVYAQQHGGPYPATTAPATTSVGMSAIKRFMRPVAFQAMPEPLLPAALQAANPLGILRIVDNSYTRDAL